MPGRFSKLRFHVLGSARSSARELIRFVIEWHWSLTFNWQVYTARPNHTTTMDAAADSDDLTSARMLKKIMEETVTAEARCKELEKLLAVAQKQRVQPDMVATQVAIDAAGHDLGLLPALWSAPALAAFAPPFFPPARTGNRRVWLFSAMRAHTKAPYRTDLLWETRA